MPHSVNAGVKYYSLILKWRNKSKKGFIFQHFSHSTCKIRQCIINMFLLLGISTSLRALSFWRSLRIRASKQRLMGRLCPSVSTSGRNIGSDARGILLTKLSFNDHRTLQLLTN